MTPIGSRVSTARAEANEVEALATQMTVCCDERDVFGNVAPLAAVPPVAIGHAAANEAKHPSVRQADHDLPLRQLARALIIWSSSLSPSSGPLQELLTSTRGGMNSGVDR